jgi:hypothetical protein
LIWCFCFLLCFFFFSFPSYQFGAEAVEDVVAFDKFTLESVFRFSERDLRQWKRAVEAVDSPYTTAAVGAKATTSGGARLTLGKLEHASLGVFLDR